jgi:hypothetical protein
MTDSERADEWVRYVKAQVSQYSKLRALAHLDKEMRIAVIKKLGMRTAEDVFERTTDAKD